MDDLGDVRHVAETIIGAETLVNFTPEENLMDRLGHRLGTSVASGLAALLNSVQ